MLAWEQCDGCATCEVETDNLRCVCSRLWVANVTQCGRCCLLLHALNVQPAAAARRPLMLLVAEREVQEEEEEEQALWFGVDFVGGGCPV